MAKNGKTAFSISLQLAFCADQSTRLSSGVALCVSSMQYPVREKTSLSCNLYQTANINGGKSKKKEMGEKLYEKAGKTNVSCCLFMNAFPL